MYNEFNLWIDAISSQITKENSPTEPLCITYDEDGIERNRWTIEEMIDAIKYRFHKGTLMEFVKDNGVLYSTQWNDWQLGFGIDSLCKMSISPNTLTFRRCSFSDHGTWVFSDDEGYLRPEIESSAIYPEGAYKD